MPTLVFASIGPYLEIVSPADDETPPAADVAEAYHALWDNQTRWKWVRGSSDYLAEEVDGVLVVREFGVPTGGDSPQQVEAARVPVRGLPEGQFVLRPSGDSTAPGATRHTLFQLAQDATGAYAAADVGAVDRAAEVVWFEREYAHEIDIVHRAWAGTRVRVAIRWGMVCWRY